MSTNGFDADDLSSTLARFSNKRRSIVCDESKLERRQPESVTLSSATNACGATFFGAVATVLSKSPQQKKRDEEWRKRCEEEEEELNNNFYYYDK